MLALNLDDLLDRDSFIEQVYLSLPVSIQRQAAEHSEEIHSEEELRSFIQAFRMCAKNMPPCF